jgi:hypothetical protein
VLAAAWVLACTAVAAAVADTGKVLALIGAVSAVPQMLVVPPLMAIVVEARMEHGGAVSAVPPSLPHVVLLVGLVLLVACTHSSVSAFFV